MGEDQRIDVSLGTRLGQVITQDDVENEPLLQERGEILKVTSQANFLAQDGAWRPVRALSSRDRGDEEETLLCKFAPDTALLHEDYRAESLKFFEVARRQSGYGPGLRSCANGCTLRMMNIGNAPRSSISYTEDRDRPWRSSCGMTLRPGWRKFNRDTRHMRWSMTGRMRIE